MINIIGGCLIAILFVCGLYAFAMGLYNLQRLWAEDCDEIDDEDYWSRHE